MGSKAIGLLVIILALWGGWVLYEYWTTQKEDKTGGVEAPAPRRVSIEDLGGRLPEKLENELAEAQTKGAAGLRGFLDKYQKSPHFKDPRKAWVQLDYVTLVSLTDPVEARRVFHEVKNRIEPGSPVYERMKRMQPTYE